MVVLYIIIVLLGLEIGSFLNVCIDRLPEGISIVRPRSRCDGCGTTLQVLDLIPIFSYLRTGGRCRYCGVRVPVRVLIVEVATGALFGFMLWRFGLTPDLGIAILYTCVFIVLLVIDLELKIILNVIAYPMMLIGLLISALYPTPSVHNLLFAIIGGVAAYILFLIIYIVSRGGMGFGDVNMAGMMGFMLGFPLVFNAILLAIFSGGIVAIVLLALRLKGRKEGIPFGPFGWYTNLFIR
jgi:leader peptidase (prepilin peptidase)/N-methyltransferase